jgi:hypothetical protein
LPAEIPKPTSKISLISVVHKSANSKGTKNISHLSGDLQISGICNVGLQMCNGVCVDLTNNLQNCGTCSNSCSLDQNCTSGLCVLDDADSDGWSTAQGDCNDSDSSNFPNAEDICDGKDNNCNGIIDDGASLLCPTVDNSACSAGICNSSLGCGIILAPQGNACDDGDACTMAGTCNNMGQCLSLPVNCDDANVCTTDSCNSTNGCVYTPVTNGISCGTGMTCQQGICVEVIFKNGFELVL